MVKNREREWRIVIDLDSRSAPELKTKHRASHDVVVPYIPIKIAEDPNDLDKLIREIVISPSAKDDATERSVKRLLQDMKLNSIRVTRSEIPFRTSK